jgi:transposase-like protein
LIESLSGISWNAASRFKIMVDKVCKECGNTKHETRDFYRSSGRTCKECKKKRSKENKENAKSKTTQLLRDMLEEQKAINQELRIHMDEMEKELAKIRKSLRKLCVA